MSRRRRTRYTSGDAHMPANRCRALLIIDNRPLHETAWADLERARKRLEKATLDIHRHEETDVPAFHAWLGATFPALLSSVRALAEEVAAKARLIAAIEAEAYFSGRSPGRVWREWQQHGGQPPPPPAGHPGSNHGAGNVDDEAGDPFGDDPFADLESAFDDEMKRMFAEEGIRDDDPAAGAFRDFARDVFGFNNGPAPAGDNTGAREIYRRLVRHLHPDRGGEWTPARARQWEQVQAAWAARDADWLARLEVEWEASTDLLGPTSPVGRLRAAVAEIDAARRDAERRVRAYRQETAWRFSLRPPSAQLSKRLEADLRDDEARLRDELGRTEAVLARWARPPGRRGSKRRAPAREQFDLF